MKLKKRLMLIFTAALIACLTLSMTVLTAAANDEVPFTSDLIKEEYALNQEIQFPDSIEVSYKDQLYTAENGLIIYPSGNTFNISSNILTEMGVYTLKYFFTADDVSVTAITTFNVVVPYYNFVNEDGSSLEYFKHGNSDTNTLCDDSCRDNCANNIHNQYGGIMASIKEGNALNFNVPINLNEINNLVVGTSNLVRVSPMSGSETPVKVAELQKANIAKAFEIGNIDPTTGQVINKGDANAVASCIYSWNSQVFYRAGTLEDDDRMFTGNVKFKAYAYDSKLSYLGQFKFGDGEELFTPADFTYNKIKTYQDAQPVGERFYEPASKVRIEIIPEEDHKIAPEEVVPLGLTVFPYTLQYSTPATKLVAKFTDCYDPNIYIEAVIDMSASQNYVRARTHVQGEVAMTGGHRDVSTTDRTNIFVDGDPFTAWSNAKFGRVGAGLTSNKVYAGAGFSYDIQKNRIFYNKYYRDDPSPNELNATDGYGLLNDLVNDYYGDAKFPGFTTGEVYVSIYFENYNDSVAKCLIHTVGGYSVQELISTKEEGEALSNPIVGWRDNVYEDKFAPTIYSDIEMTDKLGVYAALGDYVTIPEVTAYDVNAKGDLAINVYRDYHNGGMIKVPVVNGKFLVETTNVYTIEYKQVDYNGNETIYTIDVVAKSNDSGKSIRVVTDKLSSLEAGKLYTLPEYTFETVNLLDRVNLKITAFNDKETIVIDNSSREFRPLYSGKYTIIYEYSDNFNADSYSYEVEVSANSTNVYFKEVPSLPRYFIKGQSYRIEQAVAYKFDTGAPLKENADMFISFDGAEKVKITNPNAVAITGNTKAQLFYSLDGTEYVTSEIPIIDVAYEEGNGIDMYDYFVGDLVADKINEEKTTPEKIVRNSNMVFYGDPANKNDQVLSFVNPVDYYNFTFKYVVNDSWEDFDELTIRLTGVLNPSQVLEIKIVRELKSESELCKLYINGDFVNNLVKYDFSNNSNKSIQYSKVSNSVNINGEVYAKNVVIDGGLCDLDIILGGIRDDAESVGIQIKNINNQAFSGTTYSDSVQPAVTAIPSQGEYKVGELVSLNLATFSDVLSQVDYSTCALTIKSKDGEAVKSVDGILMDGIKNNVFTKYQIKFEKIGTYYVRYSCKDTVGKEASYSYMIEIVDTTAPTIKLNGVNVGDTIKVKNWSTYSFTYEVIDDVSSAANCRSTVAIMDHSTGQYEVTGPNITFRNKGTYTVRTLAQDEAGNFDYVDFYIIVE